MSNMPFVNKLNSPARQYFDFIFDKTKPKYSIKLIALISVHIIFNLFLTYSIFMNRSETNLVKNLIYLNFTYALIVDLFSLFTITLVVLTIFLMSKNKDFLFASIKRQEYFKYSPINLLFNYLNFFTTFVYLAALATTNYLFVFLIYFIAETTLYICAKIWRYLLTYQLNLLTDEDVNRLVMRDVKEPVNEL